MNARGFTLVELLISMSLSMIIIAALIPLNMISLRSISQIQYLQQEVNHLDQSIRMIEADLKSAALTGCALDKRRVINSLISDGADIDWISGYSNKRWYPQTPNFVNHDTSGEFHAIQIIKADMSQPVSIRSLANTPGRIVFVTNCVTSEISRASDSHLIKHASTLSDLNIYGFQYIQYYVKESLGKHTLYRQYLTQSGNPRNEPLVDHIGQFRIGYAETTADDELAFHTADNVQNWNNIAAIYVLISLNSTFSKPVYSLVTLENHVQ